MTTAINERKQGDCGYIAFFASAQIELYAASLYAAKQLAVAHFKPRKAQQHMVHVELAERADGSQTTTVIT